MPPNFSLRIVVSVSYLRRWVGQIIKADVSATVCASGAPSSEAVLIHLDIPDEEHSTRLLCCNPLLDLRTFGIIVPLPLLILTQRLC